MRQPVAARRRTRSPPRKGSGPRDTAPPCSRSRRSSSWRSTRRQGARPSAATTTSTAATSPTPAPSA